MIQGLRASPPAQRLYGPQGECPTSPQLWYRLQGECPCSPQRWYTQYVKSCLSIAFGGYPCFFLAAGLLGVGSLLGCSRQRLGSCSWAAPVRLSRCFSKCPQPHPLPQGRGGGDLPTQPPCSGVPNYLTSLTILCREGGKIENFSTQRGYHYL